MFCHLGIIFINSTCALLIYSSQYCCKDDAKLVISHTGLGTGTLMQELCFRITSIAGIYRMEATRILCPSTLRTVSSKVNVAI